MIASTDFRSVLKKSMMIFSWYKDDSGLGIMFNDDTDDIMTYMDITRIIL